MEGQWKTQLWNGGSTNLNICGAYSEIVRDAGFMLKEFGASYTHSGTIGILKGEKLFPCMHVYKCKCIFLNVCKKTHYSVIFEAVSSFCGPL